MIMLIDVISCDYGLASSPVIIGSSLQVHETWDFSRLQAYEVQWDLQILKGFFYFNFFIYYSFKDYANNASI